MELASKYSPADVEGKWYQYWLDNKLFSSKPDGREPYTVVIPPPNVTGVLHMGHMLNNTIQDILVRRARMMGKNACWVPGTDHASIATEAKVVNRLAGQGIKKTDLTRDEFLRHAWEWKEEHGGIILKQLRKLGASCDWDRTAFTMDEKRSESVIKVFVDLYKKGLIYRGVRMVNWDPKALTALSDEEVIYKEEHSKLYYLRYKIVGEEGYAIVATTRPETIMGDTAMCINPNDPKNQHLRGKKVIVPLVGREIPVIEDDYVDIEFGTGCLKVTPAHDVNDYMLGEKYNLPSIDIFNDNGTLSEAAGLYVGMDRFDVRKQIEKDLDAAGLLEKTEAYTNKVGYSERTNVVIEPKLSMQWFLKMEHLAQIALEPVMNDDIKFYPPKFKNTYRHWMENIKDWCISRQLWWGHRIPAYFLPEGGYVVAETEEKALELAKEKCGNPNLTMSDLRQDEDVLDTWFSSWLWPISLFDGINNPDNEEINYYYPTSDLVTGPDIIFFWVARMAIQSRHFMGKRPFKKCLIHGLIRDEQGRKMSKSLGNGVDPFDLINQYGCDAMRYFLTTNSTPGQDLRYSDEKMASSWNYINKIWNISRFVKINLEANNYQGEEIDYNNLNSLDKWILAKTDALIKDTDAKYDSFEFGEVARSIYNFTWDDFASKYLEMTKVDFALGDEVHKRNTCAILTKVLVTILKLLHPFMPFVTEEIYQNFYDDSITVSEWPKPTGIEFDNDEIMATDKLFEIITTIRNVRNKKNVAMSKKINVAIETSSNYLRNFLLHHKEYLAKFTNYVSLKIDKDVEHDDSVVSVLDDVNVVIPLKELINIEEEIIKLKARIAKLVADILRSEGMLNNPNFVAKAPAQKVEAEKNNVASYKEQLKEAEKVLKGLEK